MIVITGYKGFIGHRLYNRLVGIYNYRDIYTSEINDCYEQLTTIPWKDITRIYHIGAISNTNTNNIELLYKYNVLYTLRLFNIAMQYGIPVTYISSASVYGNSNGASIHPLNYYAMSKSTIDMFVTDNIDKFSNVVGLRLFNVYGNGEQHKPDPSPIYKFKKQALDDGVIEIYKGSEVIYRDFVWVGDVIEIILMNKKSGIYDVGTGTPISFTKVANITAKKYNATVKEIPFPANRKTKYQYYTEATNNTIKNYEYTSVEDFINNSTEYYQM
jgi:ADP-L-glycero-D-manno-heptose 6-epimerase